jgi:hypothetical protein
MSYNSINTMLSEVRKTMIERDIANVASEIAQLYDDTEADHLTPVAD